MNCGTCKYFGDEVIAYDPVGNDKDHPTGYHRCKLITNGWDNNYEKKPGFLAVIEDGSGCSPHNSGRYPSLVVEPDFGCNRYVENKEASKPGSNEDP